MTISEVTRDALETFLADDQRGRCRLRAAAAGRSGRSGVCERIEEFLASEVERWRCSSTPGRCTPTSMPTTCIIARSTCVVRPSHVEALTIVTGQ